MVNQQKTNELLKLFATLAEAERATSRFYAACADNDQANHDFWLQISADETRHAARVEELSRMVQEQPDSFDMGRALTVTGVNTYIRGVEQHTDDMSKGLLALNNALFISRDLENSIIEWRYYEIVKTSRADFLAIVRELHAETLAHKSFLENRIADLQRKHSR